MDQNGEEFCFASLGGLHQETVVLNFPFNFREELS